VTFFVFNKDHCAVLISWNWAGEDYCFLDLSVLMNKETDFSLFRLVEMAILFNILAGLVRAPKKLVISSYLLLLKHEICRKNWDENC